MPSCNRIIIRSVKPKTFQSTGDDYPAILSGMAKDDSVSDDKIPEMFTMLFKSKGYKSIEDLSEAAGASRSTLRKAFAREGKRRIQSDTHARVAYLLGLSMDEVAAIMELTAAPNYLIGDDPRLGLDDSPRILLHDAAGEPLIPGRQPLHVEHRVQAGMWVEEDDFTQDRLSGPSVYADPDYPRPQWLELVSGDSVDKVAPEGAYVHVVDWAAIDREPREGELVVVKRTRMSGLLAERSLKLVRKVKGRTELWPSSSNPKWNAPLILDGADEGVTVQIAGLVIWVHRSLQG